MFNMSQKHVLLIAITAALFAAPGFADNKVEKVAHFTDGFVERQLKLEKLEVTGSQADAQGYDDGGVVKFIPHLVVEEGTRRTARHGSYGMVIRPIVEGENGIYELDTSRGRTHYAINSGLPTRRKAEKIRIPQSKRYISVNTARQIRLPEGLYAISEVFYVVQRGPVTDSGFSTIGSNGFVFPHRLDDTEFKRYCLSQTTLSFEVHAGEETSLDRLYLRGLPFKSRLWKDHDPIYGTDIGLNKVGQIAFTKEAEEEKRWMPVAFNPDAGMCRDKSAVRTTGWDMPNPEDWNLPVSFNPVNEQ